MFALAVGVALLGWLWFTTALARRAERRIVRTQLPPPWPSFASAVALIALGLAVRPPGEALVCASACVALVAASGPDYRTGYLFDVVTLPAAILVAALAIATGATATAAGGVALLVGTFGAVVVFSRGRLMGLGDVKAMFAIGAAFGPVESILVIFAACVSGIVVALASQGFARKSELRFGPHLAVGSAFALVVGNPILHDVMGL